MRQPFLKISDRDVPRPCTFRCKQENLRGVGAVQEMQEVLPLLHSPRAHFHYRYSAGVAPSPFTAC